MYPLSRLEAVSDYLFETLKSDKLHRAAAEIFLLGGLTLAAYSMTIQDEPSRQENEKIEACASKLGTEPRKVTGEGIPRPCTRYATDFNETMSMDGKNLSAQLLFELPDSDSFRMDHVKGPDYDEEVRGNYFRNSIRMVGFSGLIYIVSGVRNGLRQEDAFREIQEYANNPK